MTRKYGNKRRKIMAVEIPTDTSNILKNVDLSSILGGNMGNLLGGNNQDGLGGGVL